MICPMMSWQCRGIGESGDWIQCQEKECAWWIEETIIGGKKTDCAIKIIALKIGKEKS